MEHPFAFGGVSRPQDSRYWDLGSVQPDLLGSTIPLIYFTDISGFTIEMQNALPNCGTEMGNEMQSIKKKMKGSPACLWKEIKKVDGLPPTDGTTMPAIFSSLKNKGLGNRGIVNEDTTQSLEAYTDYSVITPDITAQEGFNKIQGYAFLNTITLDSIKQAIYKNGVVGLLVEVGREWWTNTKGQPDWSEQGILPLRPPQSVVSGHFITAYGYDENYIYFINHWSTAWGRNGIGYFGADYIHAVLEVGTVVEPSGKYQFTKDLSLGMKDADVFFLQKELNKTPETQVALIGPGSPGNETYYFGALTKNAVIRYQTLHSISPLSGYFGPLTRTEMNK